MKPSLWNFLILLVILLAPFQIAGAVVYRMIHKTEPTRARRIGILVPAGLFFATGFVLFLWSYLNPGMMFMASAAANLFLLFLVVIGTLLNLGFSVLVFAVMGRKRTLKQGEEADL